MYRTVAWRKLNWICFRLGNQMSIFDLCQVFDTVSWKTPEHMLRLCSWNVKLRFLGTLMATWESNCHKITKLNPSNSFMTQPAVGFFFPHGADKNKHFEKAVAIRLSRVDLVSVYNMYMFINNLRQLVLKWKLHKSFVSLDVNIC